MENNNSSGIGFFGLLTIVFIVLKLTNYITWSWIWVLSPIWAPLLFVIILLIIIGIIWFFYECLKAIYNFIVL